MIEINGSFIMIFFKYFKFVVIKKSKNNPLH
jgi:hypothetical protein